MEMLIHQSWHAKVTIRPEIFRDSPEFWGPVRKKYEVIREIVPNSKLCPEYVRI